MIFFHAARAGRLLAIAGIAVLLPGLARAAGDADLCEQAIARAEAAGNTPAGLLGAVAQVESGRADPRTGAMRPWPWTINAEGNGQFFATRAQAVVAVTALLARGVRSIDVGCLQVNLMYHPDAFRSLDQAFDPVANAAYAVRFLSALDHRLGDWPKAIAAYHSQTPEIGAPYQQRVLVTWQQHAPASAPAVVASSGVVYADSGFVYGAFGSAGRVYGMIMPGPWTPPKP